MLVGAGACVKCGEEGAWFGRVCVAKGVAGETAFAVRVWVLVGVH